MRRFIICTAQLHVTRIVKSGQGECNGWATSYVQFFGQETPCTLWNPRFITAVIRATTCPSSKPHQSSPQFKIQCNIIFQSMTRSTKWSLSFSSPHQNPVCISCLLMPIHATCPTHLSLLDLISRKYLMISTNHKAPHCAIFSTLLLLTHPPDPNIFLSANYSHTPSAPHNLPFMLISAV